MGPLLQGSGLGGAEGRSLPSAELSPPVGSLGRQDSAGRESWVERWRVGGKCVLPFWVDMQKRGEHGFLWSHTFKVSRFPTCKTSQSL